MSDQADSSPVNPMGEALDERDPRPEDFVGKTIKRFDGSCANIWRFEFTDGTVLAIESELFYGLPIMQICEPCGEFVDDRVPDGN